MKESTKNMFKDLNNDSNLPLKNDRGALIVIGCNYHTTWQSKSKMRFVLTEVKGCKARLKTRNTNKDFWTNLKDLIFIDSDYNKEKARCLRKGINSIV